MHPKIAELIKDTEGKLHLNHFQLIRYSIFKEKNIHNQPTATVTFEWQSEIDMSEDMMKYQEVILVDVDLHTKKVTAFSYPNTLALPEENILPFADNVEAVIEWIEKETNLAFGRQFKLIEQGKQELYFQSAADNMSTFPTGEIIVEFSEDGQFSEFSVAGMFPHIEEIEWEPFSLTNAQTNPIAKKYLEQVKLPLNEDEKWLTCYMLPEVFLSNDGKNIITQDNLRADEASVSINQIIEWQEPKQIKLPYRTIDLSTETTIEVALQDAYNVRIISKKRQTALIEATTNYLATLYPNDSGKWKLESFHIEASYIIANLNGNDTIKQIPQKRLTIFFDENTLEPLNHETNNRLIQLYDSYTSVNEMKINSEEAFELLKKHIEVEPVYILNKTTMRYEVCGRIYSDFAVLVDTGEIISLRG